MSLKRRPGSLGSPFRPATVVAPERQVWRAHIDRFPFGEPVGYPVGGSS